MNDPLPSTTAPSVTAAELAILRQEQESLYRILRLVLVALIIATTGLCLFMYRQTKLMRFQILAQQAAVLRAEEQLRPAMSALTIFQQVGGRYPDFASNVLAKFQLAPLPPGSAAKPGTPTSAPAAAPPKAPAPAKK